MTPSELLTKTYEFIKAEENGFNMSTWRRTNKTYSVIKLHTKHKCNSVMCIGGTMEYIYNKHSWDTLNHFLQLNRKYDTLYCPALEEAMKLPLYKGARNTFETDDQLLDYTSVLVLADILNVNPLAFHNLCYPNGNDPLWKPIFDEIKIKYHKNPFNWDNITRKHALKVLKTFAEWHDIELTL